MVSEMHKRGFQGLRVLPSLAEEPFEWSCHLVLGRYMDPAHGAWDRVEMGSSLPYTSAGGPLWGWMDLRGRSTPAALADRFQDKSLSGSFADWLEQARHDDFAYAGWFLKLLGYAERGYFPFVACEGDPGAGDKPIPVFAWPDGSVPLESQQPLPPAPKPVAPGDSF